MVRYSMVRGDMERMRKASHLLAKMHVAAGASTLLTNADHGADLYLAAERLTAAEAASAVASVRKAQAHLERNANARLTLEVLLLDLPRISVP